MTLKNKGTPLLSNIKLCASFHHHMWIQTGFTVRKRLSWVLTSVILTFKPLTFCMDITSANGNNSWKFQDDTMTWTLSKRCGGRTDGETDRSVLRAALSQLKTSEMVLWRTSMAWVIVVLRTYWKYEYIITFPELYSARQCLKKPLPHSAVISSEWSIHSDTPLHK